MSDPTWYRRFGFRHKSQFNMCLALFLLSIWFGVQIMFLGRVGPNYLRVEYPRDLFLCLSAGGLWGNSPAECVCHGCHYPAWEGVAPRLPGNEGMNATRRKKVYRGYTLFAKIPKVDCQKTKLLIIVMTSVGNFRDRQLIRLTWGARFQLDMVKGQLVFVIGTFDDPSLQEKIDTEAKQFGDILQGDVEEDYHKLAFKSMSAFYWSKTFCPEVPWILKTDDDTVNNMWSLQEVVTNMQRSSETSAIACSVKTDPARRPGKALAKWTVTEEEFPGTLYPTNCHGTFYLLGAGVRDRLLQAFVARKEKIFKIDDVFITGILAQEAGGIHHRQIDYLVNIHVDQSNIYSMLSGSSRFGHLPDHEDPLAHRLRFWLWDRMVRAREAALLDRLRADSL